MSLPDGRRRVVVTGIGLVSPLGLDRETTFEGLVAGKNGVTAISAWDATGFSTRIAGEIKNFDPAPYAPPDETRRMDRFVQFTIAAGEQAVRDAGLDFSKEDPERCGAICGSGIGGLIEIEDQHTVLKERGPRRVTPFLIPKLMMNAMSGQLSMRFNLKGPNWVTASACSSAGNAMGSALRAIQYGEADVIITGGAEATITPLAMAGFCSLRAMSTRNDAPERASRPFDRDRDGFVMGEGCAILVLEEAEHARRRGAKVYCEFAGYGATADAFHITAPAENAEGIQRSMKIALKDARLGLDDVQYVNAHGTSTPINDPNETAAIKAVFGDRAKKIPISSTKSMIGHLLGAAHAFGASACAMSIARGVVHPTRNLDHPDPACDLDYVPHEARELSVKAALANSLGFGGHNCTLAFRRFEG
ncbi:MAG TPA: beta-ketoacyl-ACP synthase II [Planctomycetota bacterium]|nr:beta-ketoacyl-ACP synthase II [Planctomycetota bacterium]